MKSITRKAFLTEIEKVDGDGFNITDFTNAIVKLSEMEKESSKDFIAFLVQEENRLLKENEILMSKIVKCVNLWCLYIYLKKKGEIGDNIIDVKDVALKIWNEILSDLEE